MSLTTAEKEIINAMYIHIVEAGKLVDVLSDPVISGSISSTEALNALGSILEKVADPETHRDFQISVGKMISTNF